MSITTLISGGLITPKCTYLTTTAQTDIFTAQVGRSRSTVTSIGLVNETAAAVIVLIEFFDGTSNYKVFKRSIPANDTVYVPDLPLYLQENQKIKATAATANAITVTLAIMQDSGPLG